MPEAIKTLLTSKRSLIGVLTALFNCAMAILLAVGYSVDPDQAAATWTPIIAAVAALVTMVATSVIKSYGTRDPGQSPPGTGPAVLLILLAVTLGGCMHALQGPAFDHSVQTQTIADRCRTAISAGGYTESPCSPELQADLDAMADQATAIDALANGEDPSK